MYLADPMVVVQTLMESSPVISIPLGKLPAQLARHSVEWKYLILPIALGQWTVIALEG
jgi:hypothetical protein